MNTAIINIISPPSSHQVYGWVRRYLPSELAGTCCALLCATVAARVGLDTIWVAVVATWGEGLGFYLPLFGRELAAQRQCVSLPRAAWRSVRNLAVEFSAAELLDSGLLRPALLAGAMQLVPALPLALIAGKVTADLFFYTLAISGFEVRQLLFPESKNKVEAL